MAIYTCMSRIRIAQLSRLKRVALRRRSASSSTLLYGMVQVTLEKDYGVNPSILRYSRLELIQIDNIVRLRSQKHEIDEFCDLWDPFSAMVVQLVMVYFSQSLYRFIFLSQYGPRMACWHKCFHKQAQFWWKATCKSSEYNKSNHLQLCSNACLFGNFLRLEIVCSLHAVFIRPSDFHESSGGLVFLSQHIIKRQLSASRAVLMQPQSP